MLQSVKITFGGEWILRNCTKSFIIISQRVTQRVPKKSNTPHLAGLSISMLLPSFDLMQSPSRLQVTDPWQQEDKEELSHKQCNLHNHQHVQSTVGQALLIRQKSWTFQNFVTLQTKEGVQISFRSLFLFYFYEVNVVKGYVWFPICLVKQIERNLFSPFLMND